MISGVYFNEYNKNTKYAASIFLVIECKNPENDDNENSLFNLTLNNSIKPIAAIIINRI